MRWKRSGAGYGKRESCPAKRGKVPRLVRGD
jgi:hypothetical protein